MSRSYSLRHAAVVLGVLAGAANAVLNYTIPADRCINPTDYKSCAAQADNEFTACVNKAGSDNNQIQACDCVSIMETLSCIYTDCWNIVYSCDVQEYASLYAQSCFGNADIPYYPAPDDAAGRCSCNLEYVELGVEDSLGAAYSACQNNSTNLDACTCCAQAGAYSALYTFCPAVDPNRLIATIPGLDSLLPVYDPQFADCGSILQGVNCETDYGYENLGESYTYLSSLPATTGTASYSDLAGTLTAPSASVIMWTPLSGVVYTITAAEGGKAATSAAVTSSSKGGASSKASTTGSAATGTTNTASGTTASATAASTTASSGGSTNHIPESCFTVMLVMSLAAVLY